MLLEACSRPAYFSKRKGKARARLTSGTAQCHSEVGEIRLQRQRVKHFLARICRLKMKKKETTNVVLKKKNNNKKQHKTNLMLSRWGKRKNAQ